MNDPRLSRVDHVGSLLRPSELLARRGGQCGRVDERVAVERLALRRGCDLSAGDRGYGRGVPNRLMQRFSRIPAGRRGPTRRALCGAALACSMLLTGCDGVDDEPAPPTASGQVIEVDGGTATPYGVGAGRVWILAPRNGEIRSLVVYLHGWGASLPFQWHQAWFEHLLQRGSAVMFPAYQDGVDDAFVVAPYDMHDGLALGFRALRRPDLPVVAAGFSVGGTLAFIYAARAGEWGLPSPRAVYGIFPVDPYQVDPSLDLSNLHGTRVVLRAGDRDDVVGRDGADALAAMLGAGEKSRLDYRIIHSSENGVWADHELLPASAWDPEVRRILWAPLDSIVADAQRRP